jgi:hypothetical protein
MSAELDRAAAMDTLRRAARAMDRLEWDELHASANEEDDEDAEAMDVDVTDLPDADMPARGGNSAPGSGKMSPRGSVKPAMDRKAVMAFDKVFGADSRAYNSYAGNYGHLESDMTRPASPSRADVDSFHRLYPEAGQ